MYILNPGGTICNGSFALQCFRLFSFLLTTAVEKTVKDYTRQIVRFIAAMEKEKPRFVARHWIKFQSSNFTPLVDVAEFIPRSTKSAHAQQKINAYKHLLGMIRYVSTYTFQNFRVLFRIFWHVALDVLFSFHRSKRNP